MKILRLSTLSLTLAIAVFALGYNPSFADKPDCGDNQDQHCNHSDDPGLPAGITVQLSGGAFVSVVNPGPPPITTAIVGVTAESKFELRGDDPIHMIRPGGADPNLVHWIAVFNLCGLLGNPGTSDVSEFTASAGRKGWTVAKEGERVSVGLNFELDSPLDPTDPLFTSEPLSVAMNLTGACLDLPECSLIPVVGTPKVITLDRYSIHLKAKGGVAHQATCHASEGYPGAHPLLGVTTTLRITATVP